MEGMSGMWSLYWYEKDGMVQVSRVSEKLDLKISSFSLVIINGTIGSWITQTHPLIPV